MCMRIFGGALLLWIGQICAADHRAPLVPETSLTLPVQSAKGVGAPAVLSVGPGQGGYVHYFLITYPDGSQEDQVGIELNDQRIAWSFPTVGVVVSDFVKRGTLQFDGSTFQIEHLHGIRPFAAEAPMRILQKNLARRVAFWIDDETPYCVIRQPDQRQCLNCGDFVAHILFPGATPAHSALPADYPRSAPSASSTDDLLLYLLGFHRYPDAKSRLQKLASMKLPDTLRDDLVAMLTPGPGNGIVVPASVADAQKSPPARPASRIATRRQQVQKL